MSNDDIIDTLNDLIETSKDGEYGFRTSAEYIKDPSIKQSFVRRAEECRGPCVEFRGSGQIVEARVLGRGEFADDCVEPFIVLAAFEIALHVVQ